MNIKELHDKIKAIQAAHPGNLMARYFPVDMYGALPPLMQARLDRIVRSGLQNPDSSMGAYAMEPQDYDDFATLFDPMIRAFHGIPETAPIAQPHDWDTTAQLCDLGAIDARLDAMSMRVRVARNVLSFPLAGAMSKAQRLEFEKTVIKAFMQLIQNPSYGGRYLSLTPGSAHEISPEECQRHINAHQMFKNMSGDRFLNAAHISQDWPVGRGMYISQAEDFIVWVGEEDHLRIMAMQTGGNLNALFDRLHGGLQVLESLLPPFAMSPKYGAIASCPTNIGAGMRASLHMKLPHLTKGGTDLGPLTDAAQSQGLAVRGAGGEHSKASTEGLVDISPKARLGVTEMQIMGRLYNGAAGLWRLEQDSQENQVN